MERNLTLTSFTPAEAERITGVSTAMQRDWRRRDILAKGDGHARFHLFQLGELLTLKLLSDRGIGPKAAAEVVDWCGMGIAYHALGLIDSYEGDHLRTNEARGLNDMPIDNADRALIQKAMDEAGVHGEAPAHRWDDKSDWLRRQVYRDVTGSGVIPGHLFIWWANDAHTFQSSLDSAVAGMSLSDERLAGPIVVLDLRSLADMLVERAARAFVHVEFPALPNPETTANVERQSDITVPGASAPGQNEEPE